MDYPNLECKAKVKKAKFALKEAIKAQKVSKGVALLFL